MKYSCQYVSLSRTENNLNIHAKSTIMYLETGAKIVCMNFKQTKGKYTVFIFDVKNQEWIKTKLRNEFTELLHKCYIEHTRKPNCKISTRSLMSHERVHKHGSGGERLSKWNGTVTDYECAKKPFHDFPRSFCVQWN